MNRSKGNGRKFAGAQIDCLIVARNPGTSLYDNPMFGPVSMLLEREPGPRLYSDPLDLETVAQINRTIGTPRAVDSSMRIHLLPPRDAKTINQKTYVLRAFAWRHQNRIVGRDDGKILHAEGSHQLPLTADIASLCFQRDDIADNHIVAIILVSDAPECRPRPDV